MFRYIISAISSIGASQTDEVLGGIDAWEAIKEFERLGSSNITIVRKHDGVSVSREEIIAEREKEYEEMRRNR